jgi:alcohol dehydrogenase (cytochrome c)
MSGGATVWTAPVIDLDQGLVIFSTGNAAPDVNGATRGGDNLFSASVVAIDLNTGQYKWHFQEVHHDLWDYDGPEPPVLFTLERDGQMIPAVHHANKNGYSYILDRRTGEPLFDTPEVPVPSMEPAWQKPSPTQPIPSTEPLIPHEVFNPPPGWQAAPFYSTPGEQPLLMQPGYESGPEWPPAAYSPRTKYVYIPAGGYNPWASKTDQDVLNTLGSTADGSPNYAGEDQFGLFDALDTATGKIAWQHRTRFKTVGGIAVAGDLVFFGDNDGTFMAADASTGTVLWQWKTDEPNVGGANASPAVYVVNGREYVVMAFGGNHRQRADIGRANDPPGDAIIAFALPQAGQTEPSRVTAQVRRVEGRLFSEASALRVAGVSSPPDGAMVVEMEMHDFHYYPDTFTVPAGQQVALHLVNTDPIVGQGFVVMTPERPTALTGPVLPGADTYVVFTAPSVPGSYPFLSDVGNSEKDFGATGVMVVASAEAAEPVPVEAPAQ